MIKIYAILKIKKLLPIGNTMQRAAKFAYSACVPSGNSVQLSRNYSGCMDVPIGNIMR